MIILNREAIGRICEWRDPSDGSQAFGYRRIARALGSEGGSISSDTTKVKDLCKKIGLAGLRGYVQERKEAKGRKSSPPGTVLVCAECGVEFEKRDVGGPDPKYCSEKCRNEGSHRLRDYICEFCGRRFQSIRYKTTGTATKRRYGMYCSASCAAKANARKRYKERRKNIPDGYEECSGCGEILLLEEFYPNPSNVNREVAPKCKSCCAKDWVKYTSKPGVAEVRNTKQRTKGRTRVEKDLKNKRENKVRNTRRRIDPAYQLNENMRGSIRQSLRGNKNGRHWEDIVGYTLQQLKNHLESLFESGMNWSNYGHGGWTLDHRIPISWFNFIFPDDLEFKQCWSLDNLRPMWEGENTSKQARYAG